MERIRVCFSKTNNVYQSGMGGVTSGFLLLVRFADGSQCVPRTLPQEQLIQKVSECVLAAELGCDRGLDRAPV
jgi:hypothetical protein